MTRAPETCVSEPDHKKVKAANETVSEDTLENILVKFDFVKILNENALNKMLIIQAERKQQEHTAEGKEEPDVNRKAVVIFEKSHFNLDEVKSYLQVDNSMQLYIDNNEYKKLCIYPSKPFNNVQVQLIYPATDAHIAKYSQAEFYFLLESYEDWKNITAPFIRSKSFDLTWVHNILEHKTERERIVLEDPCPANGFVLLPDLKWDGTTIENMYLLGIVHSKELASMRDLNASHIALLENMLAKTCQAIEDKYGVKRGKVRAYLHYMPSFYHLHVHFTHINFQVPGHPERNHLLSQVIENLKLDANYYQKVSLQCVLKHNDALFGLYQDRFQ